MIPGGTQRRLAFEMRRTVVRKSLVFLCVAAILLALGNGGKGSIPYGDHPPCWDLHDNNGKNSMAGVAFDLLGDREGTRFFARMSPKAIQKE